MLPPTLTAAVTATLEASINKALAYDPSTRRKLAALAGQSLALEITAPIALTLCLQFNDERLLISHNPEGATTLLRGPMAALTRLAMSDNSTLAGSGAEVIGATGLLIDLRHILKGMDVDWEDAASQFVGDIAGHQLGNLARKGKGWVKQQAQQGHRQGLEFLTEELEALPPKTELEHFYQDVDELRLSADRVEARIQQLQRQLQCQFKNPKSPPVDPA